MFPSSPGTPAGGLAPMAVGTFGRGDAEAKAGLLLTFQLRALAMSGLFNDCAKAKAGTPLDFATSLRGFTEVSAGLIFGTLIRHDGSIPAVALAPPATMFGFNGAAAVGEADDAFVAEASAAALVAFASSFVSVFELHLNQRSNYYPWQLSG
eukprot:CAMPEP_0169196686 /NCGR_PEP_ID=MMETSP1016-20121227/7863_1 /TAXON_ID=342587 /ORGANISM="Karlodinium micrum, Strain CCMP2283" /LENGTH=151 /DNA_ID=CAMNT_0009273275 /DNA_START=279 /DNA_END=734 /DNA_ORIENTATION=+